MSDALSDYAGGDRCGHECGDLLPDLAQVYLPSAECASDVRLLANDATHRVDMAVLNRSALSRTEGLCILVLRPRDEHDPAIRGPLPSVDYLAAILDNAPDAVIAMDPFGFVTYANQV